MEEILKTFTLTPLDAIMIVVSCPLFFLFWRTVDTVCFRHFENLNSERESVTEGRLAESVKLKEKAHDLIETYEHSLNEAREKYSKEKDHKIESARKEANEIIAAAMIEAEKIQAEGKIKNQQAIAKALSDLQLESERLTSTIIDRVVSLSN